MPVRRMRRLLVPFDEDVVEKIRHITRMARPGKPVIHRAFCALFLWTVHDRNRSDFSLLSVSRELVLRFLASVSR